MIAWITREENTKLNHHILMESFRFVDWIVAAGQVEFLIKSLIDALQKSR